MPFVYFSKPARSGPHPAGQVRIAGQAATRRIEPWNERSMSTSLGGAPLEG